MANLKSFNGLVVAGGLARLNQVVCASSQATIEFSSIVGSYTSLKIIIAGRDTKTTSSGIEFSLKINDDATAGNYTVSRWMDAGTGSVATGSNAGTTNGGTIGDIPGTLNNADAIGWAEVTIPNYSQTSFFKIVQGVSAHFDASSFSNNSNLMYAFVWKSSAAITKLTLTAGGTAFVDGTTATLYGMA